MWRISTAIFLGVVANMAATVAFAASTQVVIVADHLPRWVAIEQVISGRGVAFEWRSEAVADALLSGTYSGSAIEVMNKLLDGTSFVVIYSGDNEMPSRVIVTGINTRTIQFSETRLPTEIRSVSRSSDDRFGEVDNLERRAVSRAKILNRSQSTSAALRKRLAELPPGTHPIRSQAVRVRSGLTFGQSGNIPQISNARDLAK